MSGDTLAQFGVSQRTDLIIKPDYLLLACMALALISGVLIIMASSHYCMNKGWNLKGNATWGQRIFCPNKNGFMYKIFSPAQTNYRDGQVMINIHHENEKVFLENNDFVAHKSTMIDHEEEELDNCNLDIQQELVDAGTVYLKTYNKRKLKHKKNKIHKKRQVAALLGEIEGLVNVLNSDQSSAQIHWLDLEVINDGAPVDEKAIKKQIEMQMAAINKQEEQQNENYKSKKEELLNNASERERDIHERAHSQLLKGH